MQTAHENIPAAVGIDVAKSSLSVCVRFRDGSERALEIRNTKADISRKIIPLINQCTGKVVMESTGHYHWLVALLLTDAHCDVRVVNPILAKQYTSGNVRKVKTDPADARGLARMALVADNLPPSFTLGPPDLFLRKKLANLHCLSRHLQAMNATLASAEYARTMIGSEVSPALSGIREAVRAVQSSLTVLERECVADAKQCNGAPEQLDLLTSIPGVSMFCATVTLQWFRIGPNITAKSWIAYAGLDISSRESGTWRGRCKLTKRGNVFLRRRLYSAAWGAVMNNAQFKAYYDQLREQHGRAHVEALTIVARKIVRTMYEILRLEKPFDSTLFDHKFKLSTE
jgi:transposase